MNDINKWFERKYLEWQLENGRSSVESFAKYLGISQPYLTQLMTGIRKGMAPNTAYMVARKLGDYTLLDILGLAYPVDDIPPEIANALKEAQMEIIVALKSQNLDVNTPEAKQLTIGILERHGFKYKGE